jgi:hypothetical protein
MEKYSKYFISGVILILFITTVGCFFDPEELNSIGHHHEPLHSSDGFCTGVAIHSPIYKGVICLLLLFTVLLSPVGSILPGFPRLPIHPPISSKWVKVIRLLT